jgi:hypothetical protein
MGTALADGAHLARPAAMSEIQELFDQVADRLAGSQPGVERGKIMHSIGLRAPSGSFVAFVRGGERLVCKLPAGRVSELVQSGEGEPFTAGKARPMREWVELRPQDAPSCARYVEEALRFASG